MADNAPATDETTVAQTIAQVAQQYGVPPEVALAVGYHESGLNPLASGDRGFLRSGRFVPDSSGPPTSFGIYELHQGGELGKLSPSAAFNVYTNASVAIPIIAKARKAHPNYTWGQVAAAAQRPANQQAYAASIDTTLTNYRLSKMDPVAYFEKITKYGAKSDGGVTSAPTYTGSAGPSTGNTGPVDDWIATLDGVLNPDFGWNPLDDISGVLKIVFVRGSVVVVGMVMIGTGLLLMFGREIFGAAVLAVPGGEEAAAAVRGTRKAARAVTAPIR